jgi:hypothetical protein
MKKKSPLKSQAKPEAPPPPSAPGEADSAIPNYLQSLYKPQLRKLVERFSASEPGERGFYTSTAHAINRQLEKHGLKLTSTFANDLYTGRKIGRDGVSLSLAYRLGVLLSGDAAPARAIALFYIWAGGLWPDKASAQAILENIQGATVNHAEFLASIKDLIAQSEARQNERLDRILSKLEGARSTCDRPSAEFHPFAQELRSRNLKSPQETEEIIKELFAGYPESQEDMRGILITGTTPPAREHWLNLGYTMSALSGEIWPPQKLEALARECHADLLPEQSQPSRSESD